MSKKRKRSHNYKLSGSVEVYNITRGHRKATILNLDEPMIAEILEYSGSIVIKSPNYDNDEPKVRKEKISSQGSCI
jgi:hypothetical protein